MNKYQTRQKIIISILLIFLIASIGFIGWLETKIDTLEAQPAIETLEPEIITGEYTIIHYAPGGWTNAIYITEHYYEGNYIHYKAKDSMKFIRLWAPVILPVDGWISEDKLMGYGHWIPDDLGL
jgi:hypothetical protein